MCSINGIVVFGQGLTEDLAVELNMMQQATSHRGPDDSETIVVNRPRRLARTGWQLLLRSFVPRCRSHRGGLLAVFNGEIVNHLALRGMIKNAPDIDKGDSAVIAPLAEQYGEAYVPH